MTEAPKHDLRTRVLTAAEVIALRDGARHLTLDAVAREAGVSKGGLLYHFPSKHALFEAMIAAGCELIRANLSRHCAALADQPNPTLRALIRTTADCMAEHNNLRSAVLAAIHDDPALLAPVRAQFRELWRHVEAECADLDGAFLIWSAIEGLRFFSIYDLSPLEQTDAASHLERLERIARTLPAKYPAPASESVDSLDCA